VGNCVSGSIIATEKNGKVWGGHLIERDEALI
jgi:hypothetical protein